MRVDHGPGECVGRALIESSVVTQGNFTDPPVVGIADTPRIETYREPRTRTPGAASGGGRGAGPRPHVLGQRVAKLRRVDRFGQ
jgi:hypothetical protein